MMTPEHLRLTALTLGARAAQLADELAASNIIGCRCNGVDDLLGALDDLSEVSLLLVSSDVGTTRAAAWLDAAKRRFPCVPAIWLGDHMSGAPLHDFRTSPDALLPEDADAQAIRAAACELLERFYTKSLADTFFRVVRDALRDTCRSVPEMPSYLSVDTRHRTRCEIQAVIALCGPGMSGHVIVGASEETLCALYRSLVSDGAPRRCEAEDLAGEIANIAAGKLKYALDQYGVACEMGTPLAVSSAGVVLRPPRGRASLVVAPSCPEGALRCELTMDHCDDSELDKLTRSLAAPPSSPEAAICFF